MTDLSIDYETKSEIDLKQRGLDVYANHPSTEVLMCAYSFNFARPKLWQRSDGPMPPELIDALTDPHVRRHAFNMQFERVITNKVLGLAMPIRNSYCTMAHSYMQSFFGNLEAVGPQVGLPADKQKSADGKRLIRLFSQPQRVTKNQPHLWRDEYTDPEDWQIFCDYCVQDVVAETEILKRLEQHSVPDFEWEIYWIDQAINDRGFPVDMQFARNAIIMADRRKAELTAEMVALTGLANPNSPVQMKEWLQARGYPFDDLRKDTVKKVLRSNAEAAAAKTTMHFDGFDDNAEEADTLIEYESAEGFMPAEAVKALVLRQHSARTSVKKYNAVVNRVGPGDRLRYGFQYGGASRTLRFAGRGLQKQNLSHPPGELETSKEAEAYFGRNDVGLDLATNAIRDGDYDLLKLIVSEPMNALAGLVRSVIRAEKGKQLVAADLSSIESCVIAWVTGCLRLLGVFAKGLDPYKDFATILYAKAYEEITKGERKIGKPGVLGSGFRLGGGDLIDGKRTGLWGYAENMGVDITKAEAHRQTKLFRSSYPEIPKGWYALEDAISHAMRARGSKVTPKIRRDDGSVHEMPVVVFYEKPYLKIRLPSGRCLHYFKPRMEKKVFRKAPTEKFPEGETWEKVNLTYMGKAKNGHKWVRVESHGGVTIENCLTAETKVLTPCGPKAIVDVLRSDLVWDGLEWVSQDGLLSRGVQPVIDFGGFGITPDHLVDVAGQWVEAGATTYAEAASSFGRHYRNPLRVSDGASPQPERREEDVLACALRLREGDRTDSGRTPPWQREFVRVQEARDRLEGSHHARYVETPGVLGLALNAGAMPEPGTRGLQELRGPRDFGLPYLGTQFRDVLEGHGADVSEWDGHRPGEQRRGLRRSELSMGFAEGQFAQSQEQRLHRDPEGPNAYSRGGGVERAECDDALLSSRGRVARGANVRQTGRSQPTYDLANCGPRNRFTVVGEDGRLVLVHNCVQAIARDVLVVGIWRCIEDGFELTSHVHDEIVSEERIDDNYHNKERMIELMTDDIPWCPGLPLKAAGWEAAYYRKD